MDVTNAALTLQWVVSWVNVSLVSITCVEAAFHNYLQTSKSNSLISRLVHPLSVQRPLYPQFGLLTPVGLQPCSHR